LQEQGREHGGSWEMTLLIGYSIESGFADHAADPYKLLYSKLVILERRHTHVELLPDPS
jgi:hypothetical protein